MNNIQEELWQSIESNTPFIALNTYEEARAIKSLRELAQDKSYDYYEWSVTTNLFKIENDGKPIPRLDERAADNRTLVIEELRKISQETKLRSMVVLKDFFHPAAPITEKILRLLRELATFIQHAGNLTVIFVAQSFANLPKDIENETVVLDFPLPDSVEIAQIFNQLTDFPDDVPQKSRDKIFESVLGLPADEIGRSVRKYLLTKTQITESAIEFLQQQKREIIKKQQLISFHTTTETLNQIGGLENLKQWLQERKYAWETEAEKFGIEKPRGLILTGVPGCGKSLVAKVIAKAWTLPLLHLDIGKLFGSLVGQSEENINRALLTAEAVSPCVLWIDEIDKGFGGVSGGQGDSGALLRVFGHFLEWLQEKTKPVFVVATSNNPQALPAEFFRAGRWDQRFFVDLPQFAERMEIFKIHLENKNKAAYEYGQKTLAAITEGYSGAEIKQAVNDALFIAYKRRIETGNPEEDLRQEDLIEAVKRTPPLSQFHRESITAMREWAKGRTVNASEASDDMTQYQLKDYEERMIAIHEASHAIVTWKLRKEIPDRISIEVSRYIQPYTLSSFAKPLGLYTQEDIFHEIAILYAGRVGEAAFKGPEQSGTFSGSSNDIQRATILARHAVTNFSLEDDKLGYAILPINYDEMRQFMDLSTLEEINKKIKELLTKGKSLADKTVKENADIIKALADELVDKKLLLKTDIERIIKVRMDVDFT